MPVLRKRVQALENRVINGLYIHSSPPRVLQLNSAYVKQLIRNGDVDKLEQAVLEGQGRKLVGEYSADYKTRTFLRSIPALMSKISLYHDAVNSGKLEELKTLVEEEPPDKRKRLVLSKDESGVGLLHKAVYYDLKNIYRYLIDKFPQTVALRDSEGRTAYHYTPMCREPTVAQKLLRNAGADPSVLDNHSHSVKYYMDHKRELELPSGQKTPVMSRKNTAPREGLSFKKSNIRIWIHQRNMANLQQVIWEGHGGQLLVEHSNNPKMKKFLETVPHLMGLIKEIHTDVQNDDLENLKSHTSPPVPPIALSGKDINGLTPLHKAAGLDKEEIARFILTEYPECINATDNDGRTPLHYAALVKDDGKMMRFLIEHGADESVLDNKQKTAAYYKTRNSELEAKFLHVLPECPRSAKESFAFDWSMLSCSPIANGLHNGVKKAEKMLGTAIESRISGKSEELKDEHLETDAHEGEIKNTDEPEHEESADNIEPEPENNVESENADEPEINAENNVEPENEAESESNVEPETNDETENDVGPDNNDESEKRATDKFQKQPSKDKRQSVDNDEADQQENENDEHNNNNNDRSESDRENRSKPTSTTPSPSKSRSVSRVDSTTRPNSRNQDASQAFEAVDRSRSTSPEKLRSRSVSPIKSPSKTRPNSKMVEFEDQAHARSPRSPPLSKSRPINDNRSDSQAGSRTRPGSKNRGSPGPIVDGEGVIEGIVQGDEVEKMNNEGTNENRTSEDTDEDVKEMMEAGNMEQMACLVLNGEGEKLVGIKSDNPELQSFLENVPVYMSKINKIHKAARDGVLRDLQAALDRRKFAIAKDPISPRGASPLHVAVIFGNTSIVRYLAGRFPETAQVTDDDGRTPLHYAAVLGDNGHYYNLLVHLGADMSTEDNFGHAPEYYRKNQQELSHRKLLKDFGAEGKETEEIFADKDKVPDGQVDMPFFATEEGRYLASSLGDPLIKGLTEVANKRPGDPIAYLAQYLYNFANNRGNLKSRGRTQENQQMISGSPTNDNDNSAVPASIDVVTIEPEENEDENSAFGSTSRDEHGQSMLHFAGARAHGRNALFQLLLETEINVAFRDELYRTARDISIQANLADNTEEIDRYVLHIATKGDTDKLVELLLDGYDHITDIVDDDDVPIVEAVSKADQTDTVSFLQSILAFEEKRERVHHSIRQGNLNEAKTLLADENDTGSGKLLAIGKNSYGRCSLHIAVLCQQEEIVDYLANAFPDTLKLGDNLERTALHYAMGVEKIETISRVLIKAGAKRVSKDLKGRQPTYYFLNKSDILRLQEEEETF